MVSNVIIIDIHPAGDSRVNRHISFLIKEGYTVYHIHINRFYPELIEGHFSNYGEKGYRINVYPNKIGLFNSLLYNLFAITSIIERRVVKSLNVIGWKCEDHSIIHIHDPSLLLVAKNLNDKLKNTLLVYDRHEVYEHRKKHFGIEHPRIERIYEVMVTPKLKGIVTVSESYIASCESLFPNAIVKAIPNFPDYSDYNIWNISKKIESFLPESPINFVYFGSLDYHFDRDIQLILKISDRLLTTFPRINLYIGGKTIDNALISEFAELSMKFPGRFHFLGYLPRSEVIRLTEEAHFGFCLLKPETTYWVKISPNKVFEYLMCGTIPIIRADVDYAPIFEDCSLIFDRYSSEDDIISEIIEIVGQTERIMQLMKDCINVRKRFAYDTVATQYIKMYEEIEFSIS